MRTEREMTALILQTAEDDERIRAVVMNGSRANPNAPKDVFRDYDIVYVVTDVASFVGDPRWIDVFGKRIMLQMPEMLRDPFDDGRFIYLMLFEDGNRIDLQLVPFENAQEFIGKDSDSILLMDKDGIIPAFPAASDRDYHIQKPTQFLYDSCCNNFWWCTQNVAKGICRDELSYAMFMLYDVLKPELHCMLDWEIGIQYDFAVSVGKCGKYYKRFLGPDRYERYTKIYSDSTPAHMWESLFAACSLFRGTARFVGDHFGFVYPENDDQKMTAYLKEINSFPIGKG